MNKHRLYFIFKEEDTRTHAYLDCTRTKEESFRAFLNYLFFMNYVQNQTDLAWPFLNYHFSEEAMKWVEEFHSLYED